MKMDVRNATMQQLQDTYARHHDKAEIERAAMKNAEAAIENLQSEMHRIAAEVLRRMDAADRAQQSGA
jgi:hypothetical protein